MPKEILQNESMPLTMGDAQTISLYYVDDAVNHQVAKGEIAVKQMFEEEFAIDNIVCI